MESESFETLDLPQYIDQWLEWNRNPANRGEDMAGGVWPDSRVKELAIQLYKDFEEVAELDSLLEKVNAYDRLLDSIKLTLLETSAEVKQFEKEHDLNFKDSDLEEVADLAGMLENHRAIEKNIMQAEKIVANEANEDAKDVRKAKKELKQLPLDLAKMSPKEEIQDELFELEMPMAEELMDKLYDLLDAKGYLIILKSKLLEAGEEEAEQFEKDQDSEDDFSDEEDGDEELSEEYESDEDVNEVMMFLRKLKEVDQAAYGLVKVAITKSKDLSNLVFGVEDQDGGAKHRRRHRTRQSKRRHTRSKRRSSRRRARSSKSRSRRLTRRSKRSKRSKRRSSRRRRSSKRRRSRSTRRRSSNRRRRR